MTPYLIKKGWHYSVNLLSLFQSPIKLALVKEKFFNHAITFMFGSGCTQVADQINKLYGLTLGWNVHKNSVRVGWKWDADFQKINLYAYYYLNGLRKWVYICSVNQFEEYDASIVNAADEAEIKVLIYDKNSFLIGGTVIFFRHFCKNVPIIKWKLFPYFGGKEKAKQDVKIYLKEM